MITSTSQTRLSPESFVCRRMLRQDIPQLCALYAGFFTPSACPTCREVTERFEAGECYGIFHQDHLAAAITVLPMAARISPATELRTLHHCLPALPGDAKLLCDAAFASPLPASAEFLLAALLSFVEASCARGGSLPVLCAVLPVKSCAGLRVLFEGEFLLYAIRPMVRLCPCYLFCRDPNQTDTYTLTRQEGIHDTHFISRELEEGWRGYGLVSEETLLLRR